jgi:DNA polymerase IV
MAQAPPARSERTIAHMDMDCFFVSVERKKDPKLNGLPVIVGGPSNRRGVVASCSYEARAKGVHSAMPTAQAFALCPEAVLISGNFGAYSEYSEQVKQIVSEAVPVLEFASIDEFYLDLTGMDRFFGCWQFATELRAKIMRETGLPITLGMANTKTVAKITTGTAKPCGERMVEPGQEVAFLAPLPVQQIPGVGPQSTIELNKLGLKLIGDIQQADVDHLERVLGISGRILWLKAHAADIGAVHTHYERKSISAEETFMADTNDTKALEALITAMVEKLAYQLRTSERLTACVTVKVRYSNFDTHEQQQRIAYTAQDGELMETAKAIFRKMLHKNRPVRLLGVGFSQLVPGGIQLNLFDDAEEKSKLLQATDAIRHLHGANAIGRAATLQASGHRKGTRLAGTVSSS